MHTPKRCCHIWLEQTRFSDDQFCFVHKTGLKRASAKVKMGEKEELLFHLKIRWRNRYNPEAAAAEALFRNEKWPLGVFLCVPPAERKKIQGGHQKWRETGII
jgi:hypothetical protein